MLNANHFDFSALEEVQGEISGQSAREWGDGVYLRIEPDVLYTFARHPDHFPS